MLELVGVGRRMVTGKVSGRRGRATLRENGRERGKGERKSEASSHRRGETSSCPWRRSSCKKLTLELSNGLRFVLDLLVFCKRAAKERDVGEKGEGGEGRKAIEKRQSLGSRIERARSKLV